MSTTLVHDDLSGQLVFLGTGTSHGVPVIGCGCSVCTSPDPKNRRTRCSVVLGLPQGNLLIDTTPELRLQLLRERIGLIHAVLYTHAHADHLFGLDDVRIFPRHLGEDLPVYCEESVERRIRKAFDYAFDPAVQEYPAGGVPRLSFRRITGPAELPDPFEALGARVAPIRLLHGACPVLGYRVGRVAYCTDVKEIPAASFERLGGLDVLILDCLRPKPHVTHMGLDEAVAAARHVGAKRTLLTHASHKFDHEETNRRLPPGMELAYDGMRLDLGLEALMQ